MWFLCVRIVEIIPIIVKTRIKFILKVMAVLALVLYLTLVVSQNVSGYQITKVSISSFLFFFELLNNFLLIP